MRQPSTHGHMDVITTIINYITTNRTQFAYLNTVKVLFHLNLRLVLIRLDHVQGRSCFVFGDLVGC